MKSLIKILLLAGMNTALLGCSNAEVGLPEHCVVPDRKSDFPGFQHFVTRDGYRLLDGDRPLRFIGLHATELHRIEDDVASANSEIGKADHFRWPSAREQENWIKALVRSGHTVSRVYTLSIDDLSLPDAVRENMPVHVVRNASTGKVELNPEAMRVFDRMVYLADLHGLRLIVPVIDHWSWWGGKRELAIMVGEEHLDTKESGPLYDVDSKTYAAYRGIIEQLLTHRNSCTGREYREEKAIMAWETGNELRGTNQRFLAETAALIKRLAPNQLVVDGDQQADNVNSGRQEDVGNGEFLGLLDKNVDIQSNHFYGSYMDPEVVKQQAKLARKYEKPLLVGEYGLQPFARIEEVTRALAGEPAVAGALLWGFRGHREAGGFYWHREFDGHLSYHLPGFSFNDDNNERPVVDLLRRTQAEMSGDPRAVGFARKLPAPEAPWLHAVKANGEINWMGAPLGEHYRLYRSKDDGESWELQADNLVDGENFWNPENRSLYREQQLPESGCFSYRLVAVNESGESGPSNIQTLCADGRDVADR